MNSRSIIHLDMDAFYASVEILDNPTLKGKPVIVGGDSNRGVVSAASYEARKFGVHSAMPIVTARRLCPNGVFLPVRMARYHEVSEQIMAIFFTYTPLVEPLSLDEAFLDVTRSTAIFGNAEKIALEIKDRVRNETGLTVSAGVAASKLVAKIASDLNKPDGFTTVEPGSERAFLADLPIKRLWGVGKTTQRELALLGVKTIGDLSRLPEGLLVKKFGRHGQHLYETSLGLDEREVIPEREIKSMGHEETFETDVIDMARLNRELLSLAIRVARRARGYGMSGAIITLKVKYHDFKQITRSITLAHATDDHRVMFQHGRELLARTEAGRKPVRLLGISISNLSTGPAPCQESLFPEALSPLKSKELNQALDKITARFGSQALKPARLIQDEKVNGD